MINLTDTQILYWGIGILLMANFGAMALFLMSARLPHGKLREIIREIICQLDQLADNMEKSEKRAVAIQHINTILGWRGILVPSILIGWVIDCEVAAVRKMQKTAGTIDCAVSLETNETGKADRD